MVVNVSVGIHLIHPRIPSPSDNMRTVVSGNCLQEDPALDTNAYSPQLGYVRLQVCVEVKCGTALCCSANLCGIAGFKMRFWIHIVSHYNTPKRSFHPRH